MNPTIKARIESIRRGEVPEGYKRTALGCYPLDWERLTLGSISERKGEYGLNAPACEYEEGLPKYLRITDIDEDGKYIDNGAYVKHIDSEKYVLRKGDLLFARTGASVGKNYLYDPSDGKLVFAGFLIRYHIKKGYNPYIVAAMCNIHQYNNWVHMMSARSGQPGINAEEYATYAFMLPKKLSEQEKIAEILAGQNRVIALKEKLLAEKQKQKKYLMQQLLTGKKRLPGFSGEWIESRLGDLFRERVETNGAELRLLAITSGQGVIPRDELELKDNSSEDKSKYKKICVGDIGYNTMRMWQGVSAFSNYEGIVSPAYTILVPNSKIDAKFFAYQFKLSSIIFLFYRYSQGLVDDTRNLKYENLKRIRVLFPQDKKEQTAIAEILSTADKEIKLLKKDIEQEKLKKESLMQLLLTGIVRVDELVS